MTREQIEARLRAITHHTVDFANGIMAPDEYGCWLKAEHVLELVQRLVAELQTPPTGEEVAKAWADANRALQTLQTGAYNHGLNDGGQHSAAADKRTFDASATALHQAFEAVRAYGAACRAAGRAEALKEKAEV